MSADPLFFLLTFAGIQALAAISPGPAFALVTQKALSGGRVAGFAAAIGCTIGIFVWLCATMIGLTFLIERFGWLYTGLRIAGGVFLVYLAFQLWRHARDPIQPAAVDLSGELGVWRNVRAGVLVQLANPKAFAYCASVVITLLPAEQPLWMKASVPLVGAGVEGVWWTFLAYAFSAASFRRVYAGVKTYLDRAMGAVLAGLGAKMLLER